MRPATACYTCRIHRRKCRTTGPAAPCARCISVNNSCSLAKSYASPRSNTERKCVLNSHDKIVDSSSQGRAPWPPQLVREELVDLYFTFIHDKHHSLFHQPSFLKSLGEGNVPNILLYAVMALAARFSKHSFFANTNPWERGRRYASECKALLDLQSISLITIQACVLLGTICFAEAEAESEALYYAIANRIGQMLDLLHKPVEAELDRQLNLRVWWTLYMIDIWCSAGVRLPRQIHQPHFAPMPMDEESFLQLKQTDTNSSSESISKHALQLVESQDTGIWAQMSKLAQIFGEIHDFNELTVRSSPDHRTSPINNNAIDVLESSVTKLATKLDTWLHDLPSQMHMSPKNLTHYSSHGLGQTFVALHLGYHYYNLLLFYQFLASDCHPNITQAHTYAETCKHHASALCDLLDHHPGTECRYIMVGHMLVVASTVHIHTLLFSSHEHQIAQARIRLERNFTTLMRLQQYWPNLELSLSRLHAFHRACLTETTSSFRMDQWMLRFLLEHGNVVGDKFLENNVEEGGGVDESRPSWMPSITEWNARAASEAGA